jgi:catechol 2,3-dioxygenase-like lactoylglutathione lyase family enzyme
VLGAIDHVALIVKDPARTAALFKELFQAQVLERRDAEGHDETFARLGKTWIEHQLARGDSALYFQDYDRHLFELDTGDIESALPGR